jgi:hypothetical protein
VQFVPVGPEVVRRGPEGDRSERRIEPVVPIERDRLALDREGSLPAELDAATAGRLVYDAFGVALERRPRSQSQTFS